MKRKIILTKFDETQDSNFPICFMEFINEAARVIKERKEKEKAS